MGGNHFPPRVAGSASGKNEEGRNAVGRRRSARDMGLGAISVALLVATIYVLWRLTFGGGGGGEPKEAFSPYQPEPESLGQVSSKFYPAQLTLSIPLIHTDAEGKPTAESAAMPADAAVIDGRVSCSTPITAASWSWVPRARLSAFSTKAGTISSRSRAPWP